MGRENGREGGTGRGEDGWEEIGEGLRRGVEGKGKRRTGGREQDGCGPQLQLLDPPLSPVKFTNETYFSTRKHVFRSQLTSNSVKLSTSNTTYTIQPL